MVISYQITVRRALTEQKSAQLPTPSSQVRYASYNNVRRTVRETNANQIQGSAGLYSIVH